MLAVASGNTGNMTQAQINNANRQLEKGRAGGGPVRAGESYVIGERGPELFVPESNGSVLPSIPGGGGGGGPVINNYVTIHALDPRAAADAVGEALVRYTKISGPLPARMVAPA